MSVTSPAGRPSWAPWTALLDWTPFRIDALGLVTLLGAEEINAGVGRLVRSSYLEYLPMLGSHVIAGNQFRQKEPGFKLYNITQGIATTDMASWLTRWMKSQDFQITRSIVVWKFVKPKNRFADELIGFLIGLSAMGLLIAGTILSYDWYGFANAVAMTVAIVVRKYRLYEVRKAIDLRVEKLMSKANIKGQESYRDAVLKWEKQGMSLRKEMGRNRQTNTLSNKNNNATDSKLHQHWMQRPNPLDYERPSDVDYAKVLIIMSDARAVTMIIPKMLFIPPSPFIADLDPPNAGLYQAAGWVGWVAFAVHIVAIGMSDLATQLYTVVLIVLPTILLIGRFGCDDSRWLVKFKGFFRSTSPQLDEDGETRRSNLFEWQSESYIGSRLKAEVYEWPLDHEFTFGENFEFRKPVRNQDPRSEKRQHLYAWLQLSDAEQQSMDKWDLFPHQRPDNKAWMAMYQKMKNKITAIDGGLSQVVKTLEIPANTAASATAVSDSTKPAIPDALVTGPNLSTDAKRPPAESHGAPAGASSSSSSMIEKKDIKPEIVHRDDEDEIFRPPARSFTAPNITRRRGSMTAFRNTAFWMSSATAEAEEQAILQDEAVGSDSDGDDLGDTESWRHRFPFKQPQ